MAVSAHNFFQHVENFMDYRKTVHEISEQTIRTNQIDLDLFQNFVTDHKFDTIDGNNGNMIGGVELVPGMIGQAFSFTNQSYPNYKYVRSPTGGIPAGNAPRTLTAWVKPILFGLHGCLVAKMPWG